MEAIKLASAEHGDDVTRIFALSFDEQNISFVGRTTNHTHLSQLTALIQ